jgi:hypothetical protein
MWFSLSNRLLDLLVVTCFCLLVVFVIKGEHRGIGLCLP